MNTFWYFSAFTWIEHLSISSSTALACASTASGRHTLDVLLYCFNESSSDSILCSLFGLNIPFHNHPVIKVQIVLPRLQSIYMSWWECSVFLKAVIFEVIVHLCLQGATQVLLFFFNFPDMFRISGKLPPLLLTAVCLALLHGKHSCAASRWCLCSRVKSMDLVQLQGLLFDGITSYSFFFFFGLRKSCAFDLSSAWKRC